MKGLQIALFTTLLGVSVCAQERSHATLEILLETPVSIYENNVVQVYFNNKLAGSVKFKEKLVYTIYSEGRLSLTFVENQNRINQMIDIKHDSTYHFLVGFYNRKKFVKEKDKTRYFNTVVSKAIADEITTNVIQNTIYEEEDIRNPFGDLPDGDFNRPKQGSGFLVSNKYVLTNYHVIEGAETVKLHGIQGDFSTEVKAVVHAVDVQNDLALLKIESKILDLGEAPYDFSNSQSVKVGSNAYALGYPISDVMGNEVKVTDGIVNSNSGYKGSLSLYQFSAAVQPGNSGGPLFDSNGDVIGIVSAKLKSDKAESIGYAVKADNILLFLKQSGIEIQQSLKEEKTTMLTELVERNSPYVYLIKTE